METTVADELEFVEAAGLAQIDAVFEEEFHDFSEDGIKGAPGSVETSTCSFSNSGALGA